MWRMLGWIFWMACIRLTWSYHAWSRALKCWLRNTVKPANIKGTDQMVEANVRLCCLHRLKIGFLMMRLMLNYLNKLPIKLVGTKNLSEQVDKEIMINHAHSFQSILIFFKVHNLHFALIYRKRAAKFKQLVSFRTCLTLPQIKIFWWCTCMCNLHLLHLGPVVVRN